MARHIVGHAINAGIGEAISQLTGHGHFGALAGLTHRGVGYELARGLPALIGTIPAGVTGKAATSVRERVQPEGSK